MVQAKSKMWKYRNSFVPHTLLIQKDELGIWQAILTHYNKKDNGIELSTNSYWLFEKDDFGSVEYWFSNGLGRDVNNQESYEMYQKWVAKKNNTQ